MRGDMRRLVKAAGITAAVAGLGLIAERLFIAAPAFRGARSDHFDGDRFQNQQSGWQTEGSFFKWQLTKTPTAWPEWVESTPGPPPPRRVERGVRITHVNHSTVLIQMDGLNLLTDPTWSDRCSPVRFAGPMRHRAPGLRFEDLPPIDAVLVSHNHYDHMDVATLRRLRGVPLFVPLGNAALLARHGIPGARDLDWWDEARLDARVTITFTPAQHFSARGISDRNATLWGGFVISGPSGHVYFAGDTGWGKHYDEIARRFGPMRVALLPIGSYSPRWFMKPAHIDPAEAVDAHFALQVKTSIAIHYGTWQLGDDGEQEPVDDLKKAIAARGGANFLVLEHGRGFDAP
jgi:L-ascorbate metabolism protein UlaG (beta-lactamase superfamily)